MAYCHDTNVRHIDFSLFLLKIQGGARWGNDQLIGVKEKGYTARALHQLLGLKEALEVPHLPDSSEDEDDSLGDGPPQDPLIGALTRQAEAFFTVPLIILLLLDLFHLIKQLASTKLELC